MFFTIPDFSWQGKEGFFLKGLVLVGIKKKIIQLNQNTFVLFLPFVLTRVFDLVNRVLLCHTVSLDKEEN